MIFDDFFLTISVYRLSKTKYYDLMEVALQKDKPEWDENYIAKNPQVEESFKLFHRKSYGGDWEFNEIIGYVKLYFYGSQVRGEYWSTLPSRKVRTRKKQFEFKSYKLVAESPICEKSNDGVLVAVEDYICNPPKKAVDL